jgi:membrane fusion protein, heavy metal efflux system
MYKTASLIFITVFVTSCSQGNKDTHSKVISSDTSRLEGIVQLTDEQAKNAAIVTGVSEAREIHSTLKVNGVIDVPPQNVISVSAPLGGYIRKMNLIPGQQVRKGEALATIEDLQYIQLQQDYLTTKSKLEYCEAEYVRQQRLNETKAASDKTFQQAKSEFEREKVLLKSLGEKLQLIGINPTSLVDNRISRSVELVAPISGYVTKVNVNSGKYVSPTDVLFELVDPSDLHLTLIVFENDAAALAPGQKLMCYSNAHPDRRYDATIHFMTPNIGKDRATEVHCHIENYGKELIPGMYMNAEIALKSITANTLPEDAIVKWNNGNYLFIEIAINKYKMLPVVLGVSSDGNVEIKSGLHGEKIVTKNAYSLLGKMKNSGEE